MTSLNLIMSGAYVERELIAEFGMLPPSFLPVGVGRLYDLQIELLKKNIKQGEKICLVLPEGFEVSLHDYEVLDSKNVSVLFVPNDMTLGESVVYAINMLTNCTSSVRILHGDTVLDRIPVGYDCVAAHADSDDYPWAAIEHEEGKVHKFVQIQASSEQEVSLPVACGFFSFSSSLALTRSIISTKYNFIAALNKYNSFQSMKVDNIEIWYDFGHLQNYFHSRRMVTTARSFNEMKITRCTVEKSSVDHFKMEAEANWLIGVPPEIQPYSVRLFDRGLILNGEKSFYSTDYQYAPNLAEIFVFSRVGRLTWEKIFQSCRDFLEKCAMYRGSLPRDQYMAHLVYKKTEDRLEQYSRQSGFDLDASLVFNGEKLPCVRKIVLKLQSFIHFDSKIPSTIMHGDFCFSNILYNSRTQRISVIDPRGYVFSGKKEIFGDIRYDIAKLSHSVNGFYDLIVSGRYMLNMPSDYSFELHFEKSPIRSWLRESFLRMNIAGISTNSNEIQAITALLFISMLPLHEDRPDRQKAFIANFLRLYCELEGR